MSETKGDRHELRVENQVQSAGRRGRVKGSETQTARVGLIFALAVLAGGCAWVDLAPEAENVRVVASVDEASDCKKLAEIGTKTMSRAGIFSRGAKKVESELDVLARNDAAKLGANVVAALDKVSLEGERRYAAFRCDE
jgi:hypothetical protein